MNTQQFGNRRRVTAAKSTLGVALIHVRFAPKAEPGTSMSMEAGSLLSEFSAF